MNKLLPDGDLAYEEEHLGDRDKDWEPEKGQAEEPAEEETFNTE